MHVNKTGALIEYSALAGATIAGADSQTTNSIREFASNIGLLFQVTDDLLDVTQTTQQLGKTAGKDVVAGKATFPSVLGASATRQFAKQTYDKAIAAIDLEGSDTHQLREIARFLLERES
jgi:geranylgeranyl pyrophosphate synthase